MAASYLEAAYGDGVPGDLEVQTRNRERWSQVSALARSGVSAPQTSSAGRLFDAVAAIAGVRDRINYEGQAAVELEQLADPAEREVYEAGAETDGGESFRLRGADLVRRSVEDLRGGVAPGIVAARFHRGVAAAIVTGCQRARESSGLSVVALSGGVFQNQLLLNTTADMLEECGFRVFTHGRVPTNDGGISLGQIAVVAARDTAR